MKIKFNDGREFEVLSTEEMFKFKVIIKNTKDLFYFTHWRDSLGDDKIVAKKDYVRDAEFEYTLGKGIMYNCQPMPFTFRDDVYIICDFWSETEKFTEERVNQNKKNNMNDKIHMLATVLMNKGFRRGLKENYYLSNNDLTTQVFFKDDIAVIFMNCEGDYYQIVNVKTNQIIIRQETNFDKETLEGYLNGSIIDKMLEKGMIKELNQADFNKPTQKELLLELAGKLKAARESDSRDIILTLDYKNKINKQQETIKELNERIDGEVEAIRVRDKLIKQLNKTIEEQTTIIGILKTINENDSVLIKMLRVALQDKDKQFEAFNNAVQEKVNQINEKLDKLNKE